MKTGLEIWGTFTPREKQVAYAVSQGLKNSQIAENFTISKNTLKRHFAHIFEKSGIGGRAALGVWVSNNFQDPLEQKLSGCASAAETIQNVLEQMGSIPRRECEQLCGKNVVLTLREYEILALSWEDDSLSALAAKFNITSAEACKSLEALYDKVEYGTQFVLEAGRFSVSA